MLIVSFAAGISSAAIEAHHQGNPLPAKQFLGECVEINGIAAWVGILLGVISGMLAGLRFHEDHWLGGYSSFRRRMVRLGHIAFFGIGLINLAYALTVRDLGWTPPPMFVSWALAVAVVLMPGICFLSAWRKPMRRLFPLPVACVLIAVVGLLWRRAFP